MLCGTCGHTGYRVSDDYVTGVEGLIALESECGRGALGLSRRGRILGWTISTKCTHRGPPLRRAPSLISDSPEKAAVSWTTRASKGRLSWVD